MADLILYEHWQRLSADHLRRYCGIEGAVCGPDEIVIARAITRTDCQVFIVDKDWYDGGPLGQIHGCGSGHKNLLLALRSAQSSYHDYMVRTRRWPETRNTGTVLPRQYWPTPTTQGGKPKEDGYGAE